MDAIHISTARKILDSHKPITLDLWVKSGEIQHWDNCISLRYDFYKGIRRIKLLNSRQIRTIRDVCIFRINDMEVYI